MGRKAMDEVRFHGGPMLRVKRSDLRARGVERILDRADGRPRRATSPRGGQRARMWRMWSGAPASARCSTGSTCRFSGPTAGRGSCAAWCQRLRALFFCGLAFQYAFASTVLPGVGRDAAYVAEQINARVGGHWRSQPESS